MQIRVSPDEVAAAAYRLADAPHALRAAAAAAERGGRQVADGAGSGELAAAAQMVGQCLHAALVVLAEATECTRAALGVAAAGYTQTDAALAGQSRSAG